MSALREITIAVVEHDAMPGPEQASSATPRTFRGRAAWALDALIRAGERGCTPIDTPGPRWSDYVFKLRRSGLSVETIDEAHAGPYAGHHARYVLRSPVQVIEEVRT